VKFEKKSFMKEDFAERIERKREKVSFSIEIGRGSVQ
jgi:hypothetical protein